MGGLEQRKEQMRDVRRVHWLTDFLADIRYAVRSLRRASGFTAFVVVTLALGIGMSSATYSMLDGLILRPYPVSDPGRIVTLVSTTRDEAFGDFSYRYTAGEAETSASAAQAYQQSLERRRGPPAAFPPATLLDPSGRFQSAPYQRLLDERDQRRVYLVE